ncbi:acylphosphatase [Altericroceibacterium xinjiangense]|uniref:acylphosphatase n=1 Tax=Altericroceibacterium xinjiangense TaxID=762261 RepID=UPI0019CFEAC5|nr:acylphosphatase [Altericroceibacterium xinjiangense]
MIARHLRIHGRVQGVFYRAWAMRAAREISVSGWVRNRKDGTVEAFVQGDAAAVGRFVEQAREGSPAAQVSHIETSPAEPEAGLEGFTKKPTV